MTEVRFYLMPLLDIVMAWASSQQGFKEFTHNDFRRWFDYTIAPWFDETGITDWSVSHHHYPLPTHLLITFTKPSDAVYFKLRFSEYFANQDDHQGYRGYAI